MSVILSDEEKQMLTEMVRIDRAAPAGQDKSFYLIPRSFSDPLPTLAHAVVPWRTEVQEGVMLALSEAGFARRVKLDAGMPWFEVTESGRQYADKLRSGDTETAARQVAERHENRLKFIKQLYEATGGSTEKSAGVNAFEIGKAIGVPDEVTRAIIRYLLDKNLIDSPFGASQFKLTHRGLVETEQAILNPGQATEHFPATNPVHVHEAPGSQIQQATGGSSQEWMAAVQGLSSDEKSLLAEMADIDRSTPSGQDRSFYLIPRSFGEILPTLAHSVLPWRTEVTDDSMGVLTSAGVLRRVKLDADMPWYEVTEAGRQCARHLATISAHTPVDEKRQQLRAFLCHSSGDKAQIRKLYEMLTADGIDPWLDENELLERMAGRLPQ